MIGGETMSVFNIGGDDLLKDIYAKFSENMFMWQGRSAETGTYYNVIRILKKKKDGTYQYPFVFAPTGAGAATMSTLQMNMQYKYPFAINAGIFDITTTAYNPLGTVIENSREVQAAVSIGREDRLVITIDENGDLGYANQTDSTSTLIANGIVSAVLSFIPLVINYKSAEETIQNPYFDNVSDAQRQIFGQFGNGDYCVITCEGRGFDDSTGFTVRQCISLCISLGLKFAFNLDGGGSTQTVINQKQVNPIYEGTYGRRVPTYIVFNGTDTFGVPN